MGERNLPESQAQMILIEEKRKFILCRMNILVRMKTEQNKKG